MLPKTPWLGGRKQETYGAPSVRSGQGPEAEELNKQGPRSCDQVRAERKAGLENSVSEMGKCRESNTRWKKGSWGRPHCPLCLSFPPCRCNRIPHGQLKEAQAEGAVHHGRAVTVSGLTLPLQSGSRDERWLQLQRVAFSFSFPLSFIMHMSNWPDICLHIMWIQGIEPT